MRPLLIVGDTLLDQDLEGRVERLAADAPVPVVDGVEPRPRPGGAGLAACLASATGQRVRLLTALCRDGAGRRLARVLRECGVEVLDLGRTGTTPEKLRVRAAGQTLLRLDRGERRGASVGTPSSTMLRAIAESQGVVVSDYGYGVAAEPRVRAALQAAPSRAPLVWDPHPRGLAPVPGATLVTPNRREAGVTTGDLHLIAERARELHHRWQARALAITLGAQGALLLTAERTPPLVVPAPVVAAGDPCGAGDSLAVAAGQLLAAGASVEEAIALAVARASEFVAAGGAPAGWHPAERPASGDREPVAGTLGSLEQAARLADTIHATGGRLVVASGCFDLLHPGHVQTLEAARALGDALIVLLNSDDSVRQLKGSGRPTVPERDRAQILASLRCVDAVGIFGERTPVQALHRLRPHIFAKGADYAGRRIPEQDAVAGWGGEVVLLPHRGGHSTTRLAREMLAHAAE